VKPDKSSNETQVLATKRARMDVLQIQIFIFFLKLGCSVTLAKCDSVLLHFGIAFVRFKKNNRVILQHIVRDCFSYSVH
jgi:hypothetical protein